MATPKLSEDTFSSLRDKIQAKLVSKPKVQQNKTTRGKKRTSDGTVLPDEEDLKKYVKELGGTDEDLALIADADSDSEMEGLDSKSKDGKGLEQGMSNILKEIALAQGSNISEDEEEVTEEPETKKKANNNNNNNNKTQFKCEPRSDWYSNLSEVDDSRKPTSKSLPPNIEALHQHAKSLLDVENETFKSTQQSFYNTVIASGTLSDRISALTLAVQESPLHNVKALEILVGLAGKKSRAQAIDVLRALKDLLAQGSLLPSERRLYHFASHPFVVEHASRLQSWRGGSQLPKGIGEADLICCAFEDWLKSRYFEILKILEVWCNDEIEFSRSRAVSFVYELLKEKPEQESNLLRLLVNKIGDPVKRIASQTSYLLMQLLISHPAMKMIVVSFIESDFLFRAGQSLHGQYYAVTTLNQTVLGTREEEVANKLLDIYFALFTSLLKSDETPEKVVSTTRAQRQRKKFRKASEGPNQHTDELKEKLISAVLTGVNRAYPYAGSEQKNFDKYLDTLFQITHSANFNTSVQAMLLIQQLTATHGTAADRFYRTLYESLLDPRLATASKQQLYLNLIHRALKADVNAKRVKAFAKRILQVLSLHEPSFICGSFFLLKDLESTLPSLTTLLSQPEQEDSDGEESFHDVDEDAVLQDSKSNVSSAKAVQYDGTKRAPEHANADNSCAWEVLPFLAHFHPAVSVIADHYVSQQGKLPGKPDLSLHTLIHFLDRFVYRNPKLATNKMRGASIMQPMANDDTHAVLISSTAALSGPAVNTDAFRNQKDQDVAAQDVFFHKYFSALGKESKSKKAARNLDEDGSVGDEDEDAVWKAMIDSAPDLEGASSDDDDNELDMSSLEEDMDDMSEDSSVDIEAGIFDDEAQSEEFAQVSEDDDSQPVQKDSVDKSVNKQRNNKFRALPTFASAADYAKMIEDDEDEDLG